MLMIEGSMWTVEGSMWTVEGSMWTVEGSMWTVEGSAWTVKGNGPHVDDDHVSHRDGKEGRLLLELFVIAALAPVVALRVLPHQAVVTRL
eukprot:6150899-Pyramimonas_sp.AAC.1